MQVHFSIQSKMAKGKFLSSDELREVAIAGSSFVQLKRLRSLGIPYQLDKYGTPMVERRALADYLKSQFEPLHDEPNRMTR